jgi:Phospholipase_D-nuclease N-terminal
MSLFLLLLLVLIGLCAASFWIWMLVDCLTNTKLNGCQRACWALIIIFTHLVGAIVYYFVRRSPQTSPIVPVSRLQREFAQPEAYPPYEEGYPFRHFSQDEQASSEPAPIEQASIQSQARYEEIQLSYPEEIH